MNKPTHFTYKEPDNEQLRQGDILDKSDELKTLFREIHPHYNNKEDYIYFMVLTQSCDLERRNGKACNAQYITLAAVRPLGVLIQRKITELQKNYDIAKGELLDKSQKLRMKDFLKRLMNNNVHEYFFLNEDSGMGFTENCVAFLRLSIAIKANLHYNKCLDAKILELKDEFKAKLGWMVGNIYSRVGTVDWTSCLRPTAFDKKINTTLDQHCHWTDLKELKEELLKSYSIEELQSMDQKSLLELAIATKLLTKKEKFLALMRNFLEQKNYITNESVLNDLIMKLDNDSKIATIFK